MRVRDLGLGLVLALAVMRVGPAAGGTDAAAAAPSVYALELVTLEPGIHLIRRPDPLRQPVEPNLLVIENSTDLVVVDSGGSQRTAENAIRLIKGFTAKPVGVLVNTHWHGDHVLGNAAFRRAYPGVQVIAHRATGEAMTGAPMAYVQRYPALLADHARQLERRGDAAARAELADVREMAAEFARAEVAPPDHVIDSEYVLLRGDRVIHLMHLGDGNTEGDLVVWLPAERVLATGDLVVAPIPYGHGAHPGAWLATLERLAALDFALLVPGHGAVLRDREHLIAVQEMLAAARRQAAVAVAAGRDLAAFKRELDLEAWATRLVGDDPRRRALFKAWWADPLARSAWLEARGEPIVQGASDETG